MRRIVALIVLVLAAGAAVAAEGWGRYVNPRYGYGLDIPPGFSAIRQADNGDGGSSLSADRKAQLLVWGGNLLLDTLRDDVTDRIRQETDAGWKIGYNRITRAGASWSGEKGDRIFYARAVILCHDDQAGYFRLEYPADQREAFDSIVTKMVKGFGATGCM